MDALPLVLLGIRTVLKEDTSSTAAEMVYGTTLCLPGEFYTASPTTSLANPSDYVSHLKAHMQLIRPPPPRPTMRNSQVSESLSTATHVFIRHDAARKPLQPPYESTLMCADGHAPVSSVSVPRFRDLQPSHSPPFQHLMLDLTPSTLI